MDDLDRLIACCPLETMTAGYLIMMAMPAEKRLRLSFALGRQIDWKDCLRLAYEEARRQEFLDRRKSQELQDRQKRENEVIRWLAWGADWKAL
ncbi:MAG: hypothetical protein HY671_04995 [Chloroflexi bacterium]|nr:hypothetical protein [Chloroflexota bacterium]